MNMAKFKEPELWKHQAEGVEKALAAYEAYKKGYAFFFDPGTGKTLSTIKVLREIFNKERRIAPTLIFAPIITLQNWRDEWEKFSKVDRRKILILEGPVAKRIEMLEKAIAKHNGQLIVITNYDGVAKPNKDGKSKNQVAFYEALRKWAPEFVVLDESHRIRTHNAKRTWCVTKICEGARFRLLLTGTPLLNKNAMDIYAQFRAMDGGDTFGRNFFAFRGNWFVDKNHGMPKDKYFPNWEIRDGVYKKMNDLIYRHAMSAKKQDCLDLPPLVKLRINVALSPEQTKLYLEMKRDFITWLEDRKTGENKAIVANLALTKALRLQQIVTGIAKFEEEDEPRLLKRTPREAALEEILSDVAPAHKVLVWCVFKKNYDQVRRICEKLKLDYREAHGSVSNKAKYAAVDDFNNDPNVRVFIGHPAALGIGINLIAASYSVYYSRNFSLENDLQSEARNYRGGSDIHAKITRIDLVAPATIDETILETLEGNLNINEEILGWKDRI